MSNSTYIFYNSVTGTIHAKRVMNPKQAQENCKRNPRFNMSCGLESELGFVLNMQNNYVDVNVDPPIVKMRAPVPEDYVAKHRAERNTKLKATDWTQGADSPLSDAKKLEWQTYRQALRDVTFEKYMTWPSPPQ